MLFLERATVTVDAVDCQKDMAGRIVEAEMNCAPAVRKNQNSLYEGMNDIFDIGCGPGFGEAVAGCAGTVNQDHGEVRSAGAGRSPYSHVRSMLTRSPGPMTLVKVRGDRWEEARKEVSSRHFLAALPPDASALLRAWRPLGHLEQGALLFARDVQRGRKPGVWR